MEMARFESFQKALESLTIEDDEYVLVRHILKPDEKVKLHYHKKATEWLIIGRGIFNVRVENEQKYIYRIHETSVVVFLFPKGKIHSLEALIKTEYFVLRDKDDKAVYAK